MSDMFVGPVQHVMQGLSAFCIKRVQRFSRGTATVHGIRCMLAPEVFNPKLYFTTSLLLSSLRVGPKERVLDMGTGSGVLAVAAALRAETVVAIDIDPAAVRCAALNADINNVTDRIRVLKGDLFSPLGRNDRFDVILFNPPYFEGRIKRPFDHALYDPDKRMLRRFFEEAGGHLASSGYIQMVYSSLAGLHRFVALAGGAGFDHRVDAEKRVLFERFFVLRLQKRRAT
ncbi:MAG: methyltransferase [Spirochaetes bacterium]|nr:methyltransferase [Spirochaetota bacterium]